MNILFYNTDSLHAWLYESVQYEMEESIFGGRKVVAQATILVQWAQKNRRTTVRPAQEVPPPMLIDIWTHYGLFNYCQLHLLLRHWHGWRQSRVRTGRQDGKAVDEGDCIPQERLAAANPSPSSCDLTGDCYHCCSDPCRCGFLSELSALSSCWPSQTLSANTT